MNAFSRVEEPRLENRGRVVRMAIVYTPIALISLGFVGLALYEIASGQTGFIFMLVIFGSLAFLTGFQAIQYLKDLGAQPIEYQGEVVKKWHKGNLLIFFMPSYYIAIDSRILNGRVTRVEEGGCYFTTEDGREGYIARKDLADSPRSAEEVVSPGDRIKYKVVGVDSKGQPRYSNKKAEEGAFVTRLFTVTRVEYAMLLERDMIKVTCYPHSSTVERIERYDDIEKKFVPATDGATL